MLRPRLIRTPGLFKGGVTLSSLLRIATIGDGHQLLTLARIATEQPDTHYLAHFRPPISVESGADADGIASGDAFESLRRELTNRRDTTNAATGGSSSDWESLLSGDVVDVVLVGEMHSDPAARAWQDEALRRLVQASIPIVVIHPACDMLLAYELQMIRDETRTPIFAFVPWAMHSTIEAATNEIASGSVPDAQQITQERHLSSSTTDSTDVLAAVARDAVVLRKMMGEVKSVSATAGPAERNPYGGLAVHLSGDEGAGLVARWSITPAQTPGTATTIQVIRDDQTNRLKCMADGNTVEGSWPNLSEESLPCAEDVAANFVKRVLGTIRDGQTWTGISWEDACRSLEITDAVERSLTRRRTIELYHEQITEHDTFKSVMAAGGCGMLLWVMLLLMVAGVVEGLRLPIRDFAIWRLWPTLLLLPLIVFLSLQLLQFVFKKKS